MRTILIVEDDDDLRELFAEALRTEQYRVLCACNGREALDMLDEMRPCLVFLDMMMPVMSGVEVLEALGRSQRLPALPVVVVSAVADRTEARGACRYLQKPIEIDALLAVAREFCPAGPLEHDAS
jgi:CheY-like chemotaxis protein